MTRGEALRLISRETFSEIWTIGTLFQRLIVASSAVSSAVDGPCEPGLIMRFSWGKVTEARAGIGALMVGLNVV